jgi:hypothetical protein
VLAVASSTATSPTTSRYLQPFELDQSARLTVWATKFWPASGAKASRSAIRGEREAALLALRMQRLGVSR